MRISDRSSDVCSSDLQAIYYEAATESDSGKAAVAQVILNRLRHPAFPRTVCGVVYQGSSRPGCQFSFTCDGSIRRAPVPALWRRAAEIARAALAGHVEARSEEHTSEIQSLMRISYAVFCLKKKKSIQTK